MKKLIITFFLLGQSLFVFSQVPQDCEGGDSIVLSGEIYNYELEDDCITSIEVTTLDEDTFIKGITFINAQSVHIIPIEGYKINIKPTDDPNSIDDEIVTIAPRTGGNTVGLKPSSTIIDVFPSSEQTVLDVKIGETNIKTYPNPVQKALTIQTGETITSYKIIDHYGRIHLEGNNLSNNTIIVETLRIGLYYINIKTENQTITKSFIKN